VEWTEILRCPKTGGKLRPDVDASIVRVEHSDVTWPVVDGVIDFCPESHDRIAAAYDMKASRYDSYMTSSTIPMKIVGRIVWGFAGGRDPVDDALVLLPERFDGVLLDVPVGTGVFTAPIYRRYPSATILGVDISMNMLRKARACSQEQGVTNIHLLKADAAHLPVGSGTIDMLICMNGWHVFADKLRTIAELRRVVRKGGTLIACGYVEGARRLSDWCVRRFGARRGFFTPPFFTAQDMARQFEGFTITRRGSDKSFAWFEAVKDVRAE
jgi:SAM-dependent methyltransferase